MPGTLPDGEPVPASGTLPGSARAGLGERPFGLYVHVPFCATRCGYCDFNTYTAAELGSGPGATSPGSYPAQAIAEIRFARRMLADAEPGVDLPVSTVFFGGGTPTLLRPSALGAILRAIDAEFGLAPGAEVTTEANPESVDQASLSELRSQGLTRVSFGMQSAVPAVLAVLDRVHRPGRPAQCAAWARQAGFEHVSLDLIYGTPGESDADWRRSLDAAVAAAPDHVSAYALTVETGTRPESAAASSTRRPTTCSPTATRLRTRSSARRATAGTRSPTGRFPRHQGARSTCCTGPAATGGGSGPGRTVTSAGPGGGTSGTRPPTPRGSLPGPAQARPGRSCPRPNGSWSASCCSPVSPTAAQSRYWARPARRT